MRTNRCVHSVLNLCRGSVCGRDEASPSNMVHPGVLYESVVPDPVVDHGLCKPVPEAAKVSLVLEQEHN